MDLAPGTQIGKYLLRRKLGQGGYGYVYSAYDPGLDRDVALKFLRPEHASTPEIRRRFVHEARSAAKIAHPGIVTVYECGELDSAGEPVAYIAMELLSGESLTDRLSRSGRLAPAQAMEIGRQVASALDAAHLAGIVHRDLKPDNIYLVRDPAVRSGERVKVLDFGIAKLGQAATSTFRTQTMEVFGTPRYMSPEQCNSANSVDHKSDIYTLGCILFELLTGKPPFDGQVGELIAHHILVPAPSVASLAPETPKALVKLVADMLAKDPAQRPPSMAAVQDILESTGELVVEPTLPPDAGDTVPHDRVDTTLSAAAGVSMMATRRKIPPIALAMGAAIAVLMPIALWLRFHGGGDDAAAVAKPAIKQPAPTVTPIDETAPDGAGARGATRGADSTARTDSATRRDPAGADSPDSATADSARRGSELTANAGSTPAADAARRAASGSTTVTVDTHSAEHSPAKRVEARPPAKPSGHDVKPEPGTLRLAAKPPCTISVDGGGSLGSTPRQLELAAGSHKVTLVNDELGIRDTFVVEIKGGGVERVVKDYSAEIKETRDSTINPYTRGQP